jgi:hypothetical protein
MDPEQLALPTGNTISWHQVPPVPTNDGVPLNCHPIIQHAFAYWRSIHLDQGLPGRQHLDPTEIPHLLAHIRLLDVVGEPPRFRVRLSGTHVETYLGRARPGEWFDMLFENFESTPTYGSFMAAVETRQPNWRSGLCELKSGDTFLPVERIQLPFASDGETVDMIMVCVVFGKPDYRLG